MSDGGDAEMAGRHSMQSKITTIALVVAVLSLPFVGARSGAPRAPSDYQRELSRLNGEIAELNESGAGVSNQTEKTVRFAYLLYRRALLTGDLSALRAADGAIQDALRMSGPSEDLYLLGANLDFKLHRLENTTRNLLMLQHRGGSPRVEILKADLALQEGRYQEAKSGYERLAATDPVWDRLARLAYWEFKTGNPDRADRLYAQAQEQMSAKEMRSYAWVELQRGLLDLSRGRHQDAAAHYRRAEKAYSGYWMIEEYRAELLGAEAKFDEAVALYKKVIANAPRPETQQALGDLYLFMGKTEEAAPWHKRALAAYLESAERGEVHYYHHLASFFADVRRDGPEAVKWARKDIALRRNFATQETLAWALYRDRRFAEASAAIDEALSSGVKDAHLFFHAAMIHFGAGGAAEGKELLKRAVEINPRYGAFHVHR